MLNYTRGMTQAATYWPPAVVDASGTPTLGAPEALRCRWENKQKLITSFEGKEIVSEALVYVERPVATQGYIALGTFDVTADPKAVGRRIEAIGADPNLRGTKVLNTAWLFGRKV